jgi:hypothetical protein
MNGGYWQWLILIHASGAEAIWIREKDAIVSVSN